MAIFLGITGLNKGWFMRINKKIALNSDASQR